MSGSRIYTWIGLCLSFAMFQACGWQPTMKDAKPPTPRQIAAFEQVTTIKLPTTAHAELFYLEDAGMDDSIYLKFRLPIADYPAFKAKAPLASATMLGPKDYPTVILGCFEDWMTTQPVDFQYCEVDLPDARFLKCLFDFDDPQTVVIYVMWFET